MSDERDEIVYEEYAFDEMFQQEEAAFFHSISDALDSIEMFGVKTWFSSLFRALNSEQKKQLLLELHRQELAYK